MRLIGLAVVLAGSQALPELRGEPDASRFKGGKRILFRDDPREEQNQFR
jgi:hypothetical protein